MGVGKYPANGWGFSICMATYGNGARTGTGITRPAQQPILSVLRAAPTASFAVVPGTTRRATGTERSSARMAKANFCPIRLERMHASFRMSGNLGSRRSRHFQVALFGSQLFQSSYEIASHSPCECPAIFARILSQRLHRSCSACGSFILSIILFAILICHDFSLVPGKGSTLLW